MRIVLCYPIQSQHLDAIQRAAPTAEIVDAGQERIAEEIFHADIYCGHAKVPIDWPAVVRGGRLRWIQSTAAGTDHCLDEAVVTSDIIVTSASGVFARQVAEHTLALVLGILRGLPVFLRAQQQRVFERLPTRDLRGQTVGIVGFGGNGREIARVLQPFDVRIVATDAFPRQKPYYVEQLWPPARLPDLLRYSDIVILCVPLNQETRGMVGRPEFEIMKRSAILINVARGPVVQEADLVDALRTGRISAAGLDVTEVEPLPPSSPLWELPQVVVTPHVGAQSADRLEKTTDLFCTNLVNFLHKGELVHVIDKSLGFVRP